MVLDGFDLTVPAGQSVALVGRHRQREDHRGPAHPALLRRRRRRGAARRRRRAGAAAAQAAQGGRHRVRGHVPLLRHHRVEHRVRRPRRVARGHRARRPPGRRGGVHRGAARRLRHADRRAGLLPVGRPAPAPGHRPGDPRRPPRPHPRRRHVLGRSHQGARDPRRPGRGDAGPHHDRDRPPAGHHRAGRPGGAAGAGRRGRRRHPRVAPGHERASTARCSRRPRLASRRPLRPPRSTPKWRGSTDVGCGCREGSTRRTGSTAETAKHVIRRAADMLRPYRRQCVVRPRDGRRLDQHHAGGPVPRPLRHRPRDQGR